MFSQVKVRSNAYYLCQGCCANLKTVDTTLINNSGLIQGLFGRLATMMWLPASCFWSIKSILEPSLASSSFNRVVVEGLPKKVDLQLNHI